MSNPLAGLADVAAVARFCSEKGLTSVIDATFATPVLLRPKSVGIDVVLHSATKYLNGHSDLLAGVACGTMDFVQMVRSSPLCFSNHNGRCCCDLGSWASTSLCTARQNTSMATATCLRASPAERRTLFRRCARIQIVDYTHTGLDGAKEALTGGHSAKFRKVWMKLIHEVFKVHT